MKATLTTLLVALTLALPAQNHLYGHHAPTSATPEVELAIGCPKFLEHLRLCKK